MISCNLFAPKALAPPAPSRGRQPLALPWLLFGLFSLACPSLHTQTPPLLAKAIEQWSTGEGDLAFTQQTRVLLANGGVKEERIERYDPSLPDSRRWQLIEVDYQPATEKQRSMWESRKNGKPRRRLDESPGKYLDLEHAALIGETPGLARFRVPLRSEAQRLLAADDIEVVLTVDKQTENIAAVGAVLRAPKRVLLGMARITDLDVNVRITPVDEGSPNSPDDVEVGSTARMTILELGRPVEYNWSDFKRVAAYATP
jgi:hypothetical protein